MDRHTPLDTTHEAAGARWSSVDGWRCPADFGDVPGEYATLRRGAALLDLSIRGKLHVRGPDRTTFLDGMVTNDIRGLQPGHGCNAAKLSIQGKIEAGVHVLCFEDALWCDIDPGPAAAVQATLARHRIMEDADLDDVTDHWALIAVQGPEATRALTRCEVDLSALGVAPLQHTGAVIADLPVHVVRNDHTGDGGFDVWVMAAAAPTVWQELVETGGARPVGMTALDVRRIEAGIPWFGSEVTPDRFPMEVGWESGWVSATKGCYIGQETIARLRFQGHVNRHLRGLAFAADVPPARGASVWAGDKRVGVVTSATTSPVLRHAIALALVHRDHAGAGTEVDVERGAERESARVVDLPFA